MTQDYMAGCAKFWMVWRIGSSGMQYRHSSKKQAQQEAKRLALTAPGERFAVLAAVDCFCAAIAPVARVPVTKPEPDDHDMDDDIPF